MVMPMGLSQQWMGILLHSQDCFLLLFNLFCISVSYHIYKELGKKSQSVKKKNKTQNTPKSLRLQIAKLDCFERCHIASTFFPEQKPLEKILPDSVLFSLPFIASNWKIINGERAVYYGLINF